MEYADELALGSMDKRLWLPTTVKEIEALGWDRPDVILFSGDAYIDHPSFGAAVIGRTLQAAGYRVAIVPQPNWQDDLRDFRKLGIPRLFFGISAGAGAALGDIGQAVAMAHLLRVGIAAPRVEYPAGKIDETLP